MSVNPQEWQEEQLYLQQVIDFVNQELVRGQQEAKSQETDIIELRTSMWEDLPRRIRQWEDLIELFTVNRDMDVKTDLSCYQETAGISPSGPVHSLFCSHRLSSQGR